MSQLQSDLRVCFGFSRQNAEKAEALWRAGKLSDKYAVIMKTLYNKPRIGMNPIMPRMGPDLKFDELNYKITIGEIA